MIFLKNPVVNSKPIMCGECLGFEIKGIFNSSILFFSSNKKLKRFIKQLRKANKIRI